MGFRFSLYGLWPGFQDSGLGPWGCGGALHPKPRGSFGGFRVQGLGVFWGGLGCRVQGLGLFLGV